MGSVKQSFVSIGRNLNYTRQFLARDWIRVHIPTIPYEAFDNTGRKLKPWSILRLVESVRAHTFFHDNVINPGAEEPHNSFLHLDDVHQTRLIFIIGAELNINPKFNDYHSPKYPIFIDQKLKHLGKTSKTLSYELYYADTEELYVTCDVTDVIVSKHDRSPSPYPDWWVEKYGNLATNEKAQHPITKQPRDGILTSSVNVKYGDIDQYRHTNWGSYLKYSYECLSDHVMANSYKYTDQSKLDAGVRKCSLIYSGESNLGDTLTLQSWESSNGKQPVFFDILLNGDRCFQCSLEFN